MSVTATIVVGTDGCTSLDGSSTQVTSDADRQNFLKRRRMVDCIIIGGNTARNEPYVKTPVPLVVISRHPHPNLPAAHVWNVDPCDGVIRAAKEFGENLKSLRTESEANTSRLCYEKPISYIIFASRSMRSLKHSIGRRSDPILQHCKACRRP